LRPPNHSQHARGPTPIYLCAVRMRRESTWQGGTVWLEKVDDTHEGRIPPLFRFISDLVRSWHGVLELWWCGGQGIWKDVPCSSYPSYRTIQIKKLTFVFDWLFSNPLPTNQELMVQVTLNKACARSHAHMPPATCIKDADAPSRRGLLYKQGLSPASMNLRASAVGGYRFYLLG
jgi:hypothetical protein